MLIRCLHAVEPSSTLPRLLAKVEPIAKAHTSATIHPVLVQPSDPPNPSASTTTEPSPLTDECLHLSLSRPLHLQTSQRLELRAAIAGAVRKVPAFATRFASFGVLENDERTRRFLGVEIGKGYSAVSPVSREPDRVGPWVCVADPLLRRRS